VGGKSGNTELCRNASTSWWGLAEISSKQGGEGLVKKKKRTKTRKKEIPPEGTKGSAMLGALVRKKSRGHKGGRKTWLKRGSRRVTFVGVQPRKRRTELGGRKIRGGGRFYSPIG